MSEEVLATPTVVKVKDEQIAIMADRIVREVGAVDEAKELDEALAAKEAERAALDAALKEQLRAMDAYRAQYDALAPRLEDEKGALAVGPCGRARKTAVGTRLMVMLAREVTASHPRRRMKRARHP